MLFKAIETLKQNCSPTLGNRAPKVRKRLIEKKREHLIRRFDAATSEKIMTKNHVHHHIRHRGFTLVELLVVVTIVAALVGMATVGMAKYRERAQVVNAMNSLQQVGAAHVAYTIENHGRINIPLPAANGDSADDETGAGYWERMYPYLFAGISADGQEALRSQLKMSLNSLFNTSDIDTMAGTPFSGNPTFQDGSGLSIPLGFNAILLDSEDPSHNHRINSFSDPARIIYSSYGQGFFDHTDAAEYRPMPSQGGTPTQPVYFMESRLAIICFLDGHVETMSPPINRQLFGEEQ